jgi:hypothetical protein
MSPGWRNAVLSYVNRTYGLGLSLDAPWWVGAFFALLGVIVFLVFQVAVSLKSPGRLVAVRHQSFQPLTTLSRLKQGFDSPRERQSAKSKAYGTI